MVTVKIKENSKQAKHLLEFIKGFSFVEFVDIEVNKSPAKEEKFLADIEKGLREVKQIRDGKLKPLSVNDLWDEEKIVPLRSFVSTFKRFNKKFPSLKMIFWS